MIYKYDELTVNTRFSLYNYYAILNPFFVCIYIYIYIYIYICIAFVNRVPLQSKNKYYYPVLLYVHQGVKHCEI